jgi:hypothetical protein
MLLRAVVLFAHLVTLGASGGAGAAEDTLRGEDVLLNSYPMIMAHDAASGEIIEARDHVAVDWARTQSVGLVGQLDCGARSFDYRPYLMGETVFAHHGPVVVHKKMNESLYEVMDWLATHPDQLVVMYVTSCASYASYEKQGCGEAVQALLDAAHIHTLSDSDCTDLTSLTFGAAKALSRLTTGGSLLAVGECVTSNFVQEINCYGYAYGAGLEGGLEGGFVCYDSWPGNSEVPWEFMKKYVSEVTRTDPTVGVRSSPNLWMTQVHWQSTALSVSLGTLHNSSLLMDESRAGVNLWVQQSVSKGDFKYLNLVELDNVCDNGLAVLAVLQSRLGA